MMVDSIIAVVTTPRTYYEEIELAVFDPLPHRYPMHGERDHQSGSSVGDHMREPDAPVRVWTQWTVRRHNTTPERSNAMHAY
jgi:hypothetical protein